MVDSCKDIDTFSWSPKGVALKEGPRAAWDSAISAYPYAANGYNDYFDFSTKVPIKQSLITSNFKDLINRVKKGDIYVATDVFPNEPVSKNDPIRKVKNFLFSAHRAGALTGAFTEMGDIVLEDMNLISKNLPPRLCKRAERETVSLLRSKPVAIN